MEDLVFLDSVKKMPLMNLPVRSTYVKLKNANVLLSPGSCLNEEQLKSLKNVTDLVAPNLLHSTGMAKASSIYPNAKNWRAGELAENSWPFQEELALVSIQGMPKVNEKVFVHKNSKTLIVTDLCFNMLEAKGLGAWLILNLFGTYKRFAVSKFFLRFVTDKDAFEKSLKVLFNYDFENIVVSHGLEVRGNGKAKLAAIFEEKGFKIK